MSEEQVNPLLMQYLDIEDYNKKRDFLRLHEMEMTTRLLNDIAVCEDTVLPDGSTAQMLDALYFFISTKARYEVKR